MNPITQLEKSYRKPALPQIESGDTVRVHQLIKEGNKQRIQVFEGVVIRRHRLGELTATITVRRIASGIGVEKTFLLHSPNVSKVEILRRAKVRRNFLSFLRDRRGKSARLRELGFDKLAANDVSVPEAIAADADADEAVDEEVTEIDSDQSEDALDQAAPLSEETNAEDRDVAAEDEPTVASDADTADENQAPAEEVERGVAKGEPSEGKSVQS
ncbi:MAG TPA: 50S ribosomal protein L19 [Candidatus Saccharimonas sp.]|nr:50S ribosomal protein L19 [Candidatus Saccharimonas sp.]